MTESFLAIKQEVEASITANPVPPRKPTKLTLEQIQALPEIFQHRLASDWESDKHVKTLSRVVKGGDTLDPMTVFWTGDGWTCIDGHHRAAAYVAANFKGKIPVTVFEGSLDEAIAHAAMTNSRDKLPMKSAEKTHAAWRMTTLTDLSINEVHKATTVTKSRISVMRKVRDHIIEKHGKDYPAELRWQDALDIWNLHEKDDDVGSDDWLEREARKLAERMQQKFKDELGRSPDVTWRALEIYSPNLAERICDRLGVNWVDPEELEF